MQERTFYRLTSEGRSLWARRNEGRLPHDYRRILGMVDYAGYAEVIHSHLARYPARVVDEWLTEFEALRLIESISAADVSLEEISRDTAPPPVDPADLGGTPPEVSFADISLTRLGLYVAYERIANRAPTAKAPGETVALVVEDDPDQRALAVRRLNAAGYVVRTADSVRALFDGSGAAGAYLPTEVLATLRRHPVYTLVPIIMLTVRSDSADVGKGLALGADGYVTKPYGRNTLDYVLRYVMKQEVPPAPAGDGPPEPSQELRPGQSRNGDNHAP